MSDAISSVDTRSGERDGKAVSLIVGAYVVGADVIEVGPGVDVGSNLERIVIFQNVAFPGS